MFLLFVSVLYFVDLLPLLIGGREELKWRQLAHHQLMSQQGPHFSPHSKAKANYDISDVAIASVHSVIIITEKPFTNNKKGDVGMAKRFSNHFWRTPEIDFRYETKRRPEVDYLMLYTGKSSYRAS